MSQFISPVEASLIKVSYDSLASSTATITISGSGPYLPSGVPGFKNMVEFAQDISNPLRFYATWLQESFMSPEGDTWETSRTFEAELGEGDHESIDVIVTVFGSEIGKALDLTFGSLGVGFGSAMGDASGNPL